MMQQEFFEALGFGPLRSFLRCAHARGHSVLFGIHFFVSFFLTRENKGLCQIPSVFHSFISENVATRPVQLGACVGKAWERLMFVTHVVLRIRVDNPAFLDHPHRDLQSRM